MQEIPIISGFTAGELTPWLNARCDLQAYQRGAAEITNFQILPYGGIQTRPGTSYIGTLGNGQVRMCPFSYAENDALMLVFHIGHMQVYRDGVVLTNEDGSVYELPTPWTTWEQLEALHFNQVNDAVYACCSTHPPVVLYRYTDTNWRCVQPEFNIAPREQYSRQDGTLTAVFENDADEAGITIEGGSLHFDKSMENSELVLADVCMAGRILFANEVYETKAMQAVDLSKNAVGRGTVLYQTDSTANFHYFYRCVRDYSIHDFNGSTSLSDYPHFFQPGIMRLDSDGLPYDVQRDWELTTSGTWNAHWELWRSYDTPEEEPDFHLWSWTCIKTFSQSDYETRKNWALSGSEARPCRMVLVCRCCSDARYLGAMVVFKILGGIQEYRFRITSVSDEKHARGKVMQSFVGRPACINTRDWSFGAMGARNGYPAFSAMFQGRLWLAGMPGLPTTLLGSAVDDFQNFRMGSSDDDALHLSIMGNDQSSIRWICTTRQLLIGTSDGEWVLSSGTGNAITPGAAFLRLQSSVGSEAMPARAVENTVLFVQRGGQRVREIAYRLESDGYSTTDISMLAEHMFTPGVKEWCVQRGTDTQVWVLMNNCSLAVLTVNMEQRVTAWQRVEMTGRTILTMSTLQSRAGKDDEVWFVSRLDNSGVVVLERMCCATPHLDCLVEIEASEEAALPAVPHLDGCERRVVDIETGAEVSCCGEFQPGRRYRVGIPIEARLCTMPMESNLSFNSVRQFSRFKLRMLESDTDFDFRGSVQDAWEQCRAVPGTGISVPYTGSIRLAQMPDAAVGQALCIRYRGHHDFRLLAISQEVDHHGK